MTQKRILIAGGAGYIGSVLSPYLKAQNYDITIVDQCWFGNDLPEDMLVIKKDIFDLRAPDLENFDTVIFLAGLSNDPMAEFSPKDNFIYNTALPAYLGFMAREAGVKRLIYASSCSVYGYTHNSTFTEDDIAISNYPYGVSKLQGEQALLSLADENFTVVCLRQGTVSGYSPRMRLDLAINTMFKHALQKNEIILSNHKIWRPILGLTDLCNAYHGAIEAPLTHSEIFNISSFNTTVGELAKNVAAFVEQHYGLTIPIHDRQVQDYRNYKVSTEKAEEMLGYSPKQDVLDIINGLHQNLSTFSNFDDPRFYNIEVFKKLILSRSLMS